MRKDFPNAFAYMGLAQNLKRARESAGLTQQALADLLKVNVVTISKYERGIDEPRARRLMQLAKALGVQANALTDDGEDVPRGTPDPATGSGGVLLAEVKRLLGKGDAQPAPDLVRQIDEINQLDLGEWHRTLRIDSLAAAYRAHAMAEAELARKEAEVAAAARARAAEAAERASEARANAPISDAAAVRASLQAAEITKLASEVERLRKLIEGTG